MTTYVKFFDTRHEKIQKSKVQKLVIFGRKPKPLAHLNFSTDFKNYNGYKTFRGMRNLCSELEKNFQNLTHPNSAIEFE